MATKSEEYKFIVRIDDTDRADFDYAYEHHRSKIAVKFTKSELLRTLIRNEASRIRAEDPAKRSRVKGKR